MTLNLTYFQADLRFEDDPELTKSYEMNTVFETTHDRQVDVITTAFSFGEVAVRKNEVF